MKKIFFFLSFVLLAVSGYTQTYRTITIDGNNDFNIANERFNTTSGTASYGYVTWDENNLYIGFSGNTPAGSLTDDNRVVHIYIDSDPQLSPTSGTGTTTGEQWRWHPTLPFTANYHYAFKTVNNEEVRRVFNGNGWDDSNFATSNWKNTSTSYWELKIERAGLGNPEQINLVAYIEEDWDNGSQVSSGIPSNSFTNSSSKPALNIASFLNLRLYNRVKPVISYNLNNTQWDIKITATTDNKPTVSTYAGMALNATDGYDVDVEFPKTPLPPSDYFDIAFPRAEWTSALGPRYDRDYRALANLSATEESWEFNVETDIENQNVTLNFSQFSEIPSNYGITLIDHLAETSQDIRQNQTYTFNTGLNGTRGFTIVIGYVPSDPTISVTPLSLDFGGVKVNTTDTLTVSITNNGEIDLEVTDLNFDNNAFSVLGDTAFTVAFNQTVTVQVEFDPTEAIIYEGELVILSNDPLNPSVTVDLSGTGLPLEAQLEVRIESLGFNSVEVGFDSTNTFWIYNTGDADLEVDSIVSDNSYFTYNSIPRVDRIVAPGDSSEVSVTFAPLEAGNFTGNLTIYSNSVENDVFALQMSGSGYVLQPEIAVDPDTLNFGSVTVNEEETLSFKIYNNGEGVLMISNITSSNEAFTFTFPDVEGEELSIDIEPGDSVSVNVTFSPVESGDYTGTINIFSNDPQTANFAVVLQGTGYQPFPVISVDKDTLNFGQVIVSYLSTLDLKIYNTGDADLSISEIVSSNSAFGAYYSGGEFTIAPGDSTQITVAFEPMVVQNYNATLTLVSNAAEDLVIVLLGEGTESTVSTTFAPGWSMMSLPVEPNNTSVSSVLSGLPPYFIYGLASNGTYTTPSDFQMGRGYWLGLESTGNLEVEGTPRTTNLEYNLRAGWNILSTPFVRSYSDDKVYFRKNDTLKSASEAVDAGWIQNVYYTYDTDSSKYDMEIDLQQWKGYFFTTLTEGVSVNFYVDSTNSDPLRKIKQPVTPLSIDNWFVPITAKMGSVSDRLLAFGVAEGATDGFDAKFDYAKPPVSPAPNTFETFFSYTDWNAFVNKFSTDIREPYMLPSSGKSWNFRVQSKATGQLTLSWSDILTRIPEEIRNSYDFILKGPGIAGGINMLNITEYTFNVSPSFTYTFQISSTVTGLEDLSNTPSTYKLDQNFPNPFNPSTVINFAIVDAGQVELKIYDVLGNEVKTLVNDFMQPGNYSVTFDAAGLASGVYIYKITAGKFSAVKKLTLLK